MAEPKVNELMEKIVSLCKRRGFIYQSSEIYGGINGFWDYGPLGAELKRNVKDAWWRTMVHHRDDVVGLEATIIMHPQIWRASGHVDTFADMMRECPMTKKRVRADQVEPQSGIAYTFLGAIYNVNMSAALEALDEYVNEYPLTSKSALNKTVLNHRIYDLLKRDFPELRRDELVTEAACLTDVLQREIHIEAFEILLPRGKPPESAQLAAQHYYSVRMGTPTLPKVIGGASAKVEASTDYHPESGVRLGPPRPFNLMLQTWVGPIQSDENVAYLRPETAQAIFAQFKNVLETSRQKVPFGIAQVGKAFRNEVTPRNFTFRSREFEQMELEFFIKPDEAVEAISGSVTPAAELDSRPSPLDTSSWGWEAWHKYWVEQRIQFYESIGLPRKDFVEYWQKPDELAHYARATVDILYKFPFSKRDEKGELMGEELEGIAARSDFDLSQHARFSGKPMGVFDEDLRTAWGKLDDAKKQTLWQRYYENRKRYLTKTARPDETPEKIEKAAKEDADGLAKGQYIPHVIEPSAGVDRLILALLCNAYTEVRTPDDKGKAETRVVMKFHPRIAPNKVGVFPLLKNKPELVKKAQEVRDLLRPHLTVFYDDAGAIGRRYARQDEAGTPFGVTIDFDTLGEKPELLDTVTLRERDTMQQTRVRIADLAAMLLEKVR